MWQRVRWEMAILRLLFTPIGHSYSSCRHRNQPQDFPPTCKSYERLAEVWGQYSTLAARYDPFLGAAGRHFAVPIRSVLDLACGPGLLVRRLAEWAESVVGLDASEA